MRLHILEDKKAERLRWASRVPKLRGAEQTLPRGHAGVWPPTYPPTLSKFSGLDGEGGWVPEKAFLVWNSESGGAALRSEENLESSEGKRADLCLLD